jgi:cysteine desulfurase/selenocysteine lyase
VDDEGRLDLEDLQKKVSDFGKRLKLIALPHVSNTLGTLNPVERVVQIVSQLGKDRPLILVDAAQSAPHMKLNFHTLGIDFMIFSGHKMLGPMGVGGLFVREELMKNNQFRPWLFGGGMIEAVYQDHTDFHSDLDERFVAGTPDVASAVGLAEACNYLSQLGMADVEVHDRSLVAYALEHLAKIPEVQIIGPTNDVDRIGSVAFLYEGVHAHDVAQILDSQGIAVRSGHHCTMPLHDKFHWQATVRASFQVYNTTDDIDILVEGLKKVKEVFKK